jgi:hypothetical protein
VEVGVGQGCNFASTRGSFEEAFLDEEGFVDFLEGTGVFAESGGDGGESDRPTGELINDGGEESVVNAVKAVAVDIESFKGIAGDVFVDASVALHLGKVTDTSEEGVGDAGGAPAAGGNLVSGGVAAANTEDVGTTEDDASKGGGVVVFEVEVDAEASAEGAGEESGAGGSTDEGEGVEVNLNGAGGGTFVNEDVNAVVLHGGVEVLFDDGGEAMDLVDEEDVVPFEGGEQSGEVTGLIEDRPGGYFEADLELVGDDVGEGGLT